ALSMGGVEVVAGLPVQVAGGFDLHAGVGPHDADAGGADDPRGPREGPRDDPLPLAGLADEVVGGDVDVAEVDAGGDDPGLAGFVVDGDHLDAGRVAGDGDHGEGLARPLGGVGPADDRVQGSAAAVP